MNSGAAPGFLDALRALRDALEEAGAPWMCIGGVAVIALGVPRVTVDVDATVLGAAVDPSRLLDVLSRHGIVPRIQNAGKFAETSQVLLVKHTATEIPLDITLAWLPFEEEAVRASHVVDYAKVSIRVPRPEDLIVYKMVASRPRDLEDAEKLLLLYGSALDIGQIRDVVGQFAEALEDRTRPENLERLLRQAGLSGDGPA